MLPARTILVAAGTQPNTVLAREEPEHVALDGRYFRALDEDGNPATPERVAKPDAVRVLTQLRAGRARGQLLRRPAPVLRRQCRQGDGRRQAGLSGGQPHAGAARAVRACADASWSARLDDELRARVHEVDRLTPNIVEVVVEAPMAARAFQPGPVLSAAELRDAGAARRRHDAGDGGAGADRRLGRSRAGPAVDDRARDGRLVRSLRAAEAGRAGDPDGPDRDADRDARRARPCCWSAAGSATRCCSRSARRCARAARACSISPATRRSIDRYKVEEIERAADVRRVVLRRGAGLRAGPAAGPRLCRQHRRRRSRPMARGRSGRSTIPLGESTASSRSARTA